jgi:hypothetical protein
LRVTSASNKSNNLTEQNPFKHMIENQKEGWLTPIKKKSQVRIIKEISFINNKIIKQTKDALVKIN